MMMWPAPSCRHYEGQGHGSATLAWYPNAPSLLPRPTVAAGPLSQLAHSFRGGVVPTAEQPSRAQCLATPSKNRHIDRQTSHNPSTKCSGSDSTAVGGGRTGSHQIGSAEPAGRIHARRAGGKRTDPIRQEHDPHGLRATFQLRMSTPTMPPHGPAESRNKLEAETPRACARQIPELSIRMALLAS